MSLASSFLTATETAAAVAAGRLSVTQVANDHIARFEERDAAVHAWAYYNPEKILQDAKKLDEIPRGSRGPLYGVTIGVKDIMNTFDMPTAHGSGAYKDHQPGEDASIVHILRQAGALIIGKAHTTEFASIMYGPPTRNPFDPTRTPGGSSSGSAAAVRDFQCHISLGTQTAGSMIRPASFNGIFGMKPTWNSVPREGIKIASLILDTPGFYARSVQDLQLVLKVINVHDDIPPSPTPKPLSQCRFAYIKTASWLLGEGPSKELQGAWETSRQSLEAAGAEVEEIDLGPVFANIAMGRQATIMTFDKAINFLNEYRDPEHRKHLNEDLAAGVENRENITKAQYLHALDSLAVLRPEIDRIAGQYDAIITPSAIGEAPVGEKTGDPRFCAMWTILHVPCVNVPGFVSDNGMPLGLTLATPRFHDEKLLAVSQTVAQIWNKDEGANLRDLPRPPGAGLLTI